MDDLRCNSLKCRKSLGLEGSAVVTTCSHIFCVECANALFSTPQICPACETSLPDSDDVVQTALNPPDSYKTSVLSGLAPAMIFDIASRAMSFYTYQIQQENAFQDMVTKNAQERIAVLESQNNMIMREATSEITLLKERVATAERELELERRKVRDLHETHKANAKAYNKLKGQYDKAKQRALLNPTAQPFGNTNNPPPPSRQSFGNGLAPGQASTGATPLRTDSSASISSQNQAHLAWRSGIAPGGGGAGVPIAQNQSGSATRPRRSLQESHGPHQVGGGTGGGGGGFGAGGFVGGGAAVPSRKPTRTGSNDSSDHSGGSGGSGGGGERQHRRKNAQQQQQRHQMPEYLGQAAPPGNAVRRGGFRPATFGNG